MRQCQVRLLLLSRVNWVLQPYDVSLPLRLPLFHSSPLDVVDLELFHATLAFELHTSLNRNDFANDSRNNPGCVFPLGPSIRYPDPQNVARRTRLGVNADYERQGGLDVTAWPTAPRRMRPRKRVKARRKSEELSRPSRTPQTAEEGGSAAQSEGSYEASPIGQSTLARV